MTAFLAALAPVIAIVALGRVLAWREVLTSESWRGLERICYVLIFPALIVRVLANAPFDEAPWRIAAALIAAQLVMALIGWGSIFFKSIERPAVGSLVQSNTRWNTFAALSIAGSLYGEEGLALVAIAAAAMIPTANILSITALSHYGDKPDGAPQNRPLRDMATNPLVIACLIGGGLNVTGLTPTGVLDEILSLIAGGAIALGLLTAGAGIDLGALSRSGPRTLVWSLVRLLAMPVLAFGFALALGLGGLGLAVVVISASTPTATVSYILARQLGGDAVLTANLIAMQTVLAAATMPLLFWAFIG